MILTALLQHLKENAALRASPFSMTYLYCFRQVFHSAFDILYRVTF
jgi:hypothetical protein